MKNVRTLSLLLALVINLLPMARLGLTTSHLCLRPAYAVVFQWTGIAAALLGSYDAVSGASTFITSPSQASGKVGEPFSYRITSAPDQGNVFKADPLPSGLTLGTTKKTRSFITGTPTEPGTFTLTIVASDDNRASRTISKTLTITIEAAILPLELLNTPLDQSIEAGQDLFLSVLAIGSEPITYQWYHNDTPINDQTTGVLKLRNAEVSQSGEYRVTIENPVNTITSTPVTVTISEPAPQIPPRISGISSVSDGVQLTLLGTPGAPTTVEFCESLSRQNWQRLNTLTLSDEGTAAMTDQDSGLTQRFYRVRME